MKKYIIDEETLVKLISSDWELDNLYKYGVDNWEGFGEYDKIDEFTRQDILNYIKKNYSPIMADENETQ